MSLSDEIQKLAALRDAGSLSDTEFEAAKARLLQGNPAPSGPPELPKGIYFSSGPARPAAMPAMPGMPPMAKSEAELTRETNNWAMALHLSALAGYVVPLAGWAAPILIWLLKRDELPRLEEHGCHAVNWIISALIYTVISGLLCLVLIGFPLLLVLLVLGIAFPIMAGVKASNGEVWRYPLTIDFLKPRSRTF